MALSLKAPASAASRGNTDLSKVAAHLRCPNAFPLACLEHGEVISVRCRRKACAACRRWVAWQCSERFAAGIAAGPIDGKWPCFFTLTFARHRAPTEEEAQLAWRRLRARLRWRDRLGAYGWTVQRQNNATRNAAGDILEPGSIHLHGIGFFRLWPREDRLAEWRRLLTLSGFDVQNRLVVARPEHAKYCARYIARDFAVMAPLKRTYSFSRDFPQSPYVAEKKRVAEAGAAIGLQAECEWVPAYLT